MSWFFLLRVYLVGFCMGVADLIPGVSGGTIAFVCGVYDRLLEGIKSFDLTSLRLLRERRWAELRDRIPWLFLIALGLGIVSAILSLSHLLGRLFVSHPVELWSFFFGLVAASIGLLVVETWRWRPVDFVVFAAATVLTYVVVGLPVTRTPDSLLFLFLSGAIAICAMILPGISGSYILVILGKYQEVLEALNARDFVKIGVFLLGIVVGVLSFVRIVSWLLRRWRHLTLVALTGVMAGALRTVWPWKETVATRIDSKGAVVPLSQVNVPPPPGPELAVALGLALCGCVAVLLISRLGRARSKPAGL